MLKQFPPFYLNRLKPEPAGSLHSLDTVCLWHESSDHTRTSQNRKNSTDTAPAAKLCKRQGSSRNQYSNTEYCRVTEYSKLRHSCSLSGLLLAPKAAVCPLVVLLIFEGELSLQKKSLEYLHENKGLSLLYLSSIWVGVTKQPSCSFSQVNPSEPGWLHAAPDTHIALDHQHLLSFNTTAAHLSAVQLIVCWMVMFFLPVSAKYFESRQADLKETPPKNNNWMQI